MNNIESRLRGFGTDVIFKCNALNSRFGFRSVFCSIFDSDLDSTFASAFDSTFDPAFEFGNERFKAEYRRSR